MQSENSLLKSLTFTVMLAPQVMRRSSLDKAFLAPCGGAGHQAWLRGRQPPGGCWAHSRCGHRLPWSLALFCCFMLCDLEQAT